ncbi:MAG: hypothetical protein OXU20_00585 [Myxococcales bacterium]|nr:hypothetical protein [Myxococcales bacterium]
MTDTAWQIVSWDRERGSGSIRCGDQVLEFDASVALVDDFDAGEGVHVHLAGEGKGFRVTKIWPDDPRVPDPGVDRPVPELTHATQVRIAKALDAMAVHNDYRVERLSDGDLIVHGDDILFENGPSTLLRFVGIEYLDLPFAWDGKSFRLANAKERSYLASRCEVRADTAAIKVVDSELRAYFVVCADFQLESRR